MRNPNDILINLRKHSNESTYQYLRLYRNLFNEQMFYAAYQRIYAKPGNMTSSTDGRTIDQMTLQRYVIPSTFIYNKMGGYFRYL